MQEQRPGSDITIQYSKIGRDYLFIIAGGDEHIGAVSTAYRDPSTDEHEWVVQTNRVPGHKEYVLTEPMAQQAASQLKTTVTVCAGIHYDNLSSAHIDAVVEHAWSQFLLMLSTLD